MEMNDPNVMKFLGVKGQFIKAKFRTTKKPAAAFKGKLLEKLTSGVFTAGKAFENLKSVKDGIAAGERGDVGPLPFGTWVVFPHVIKHTPKGGEETFYFRFYPAANNKPKVVYFVDGNEVTKEVFNSFLTPSDQKPSNEPCFVVKSANIVSLFDSEEETAGDAA